MNAHEAKIYVELILEHLEAMGIISEMVYGRITENQKEGLAALVSAKSEE